MVEDILSQNIDPSGGWGSFRLLKLPISLDAVELAFVGQDNYTVVADFRISTKTVSRLWLRVQLARTGSLAGSTFPSS